MWNHTRMWYSLLLLIGLAALANTAIVPANTIKKPGTCPALQIAGVDCPLPPNVHNTLEFNSYLMTIAGCLFDGDCAGTDKCCFDGCKTGCVKIAKENKRQASKCPKANKTAPFDCDYVDDHIGEHRCNVKGDCGDAEECCFDGCESKCIRLHEQKNVWVRPGRCPTFDETNTQQCLEQSLERPDNQRGETIFDDFQECHVDLDCNSTSKCCNDGCRMKCVMPLMEKQTVPKDDRESQEGNEGDRVKIKPTSKTDRPLQKERTFVLIKPDGVRRGLVSEIIHRFEKTGCKLVAMKLMKPTKDLLETHYLHLQVKSLLDDMMEYVRSGPVIAMIWQGAGIIRRAKSIIGIIDPLKLKPGTVRGDFTIQIGKDIVHSSETTRQARHEITLWFSEVEIHDW